MLVERFKQNPILKPNKNQSWEAYAVFNGCPLEEKGYVHLVYRALSLPHFHSLTNTILNVSNIGIAQSRDGINFFNRRRFIIPDQNWDRFGCEDPRITKLDNEYYIFYTALSEYPFKAEGIKVGLAISKDLKTVYRKYLITPFNAKAMTLFPEKINRKIFGLLTVHSDKPPAKICLVNFDKKEDLWSEVYWHTWYRNFDNYALPLQKNLNDHIEVGTPPLKTKKGWLVIYSYIKNYGKPNQLFSVEAVLLDLKDPFKIIAKTSAPLLTPEEYYEKIGYVPNVVFPSGAIIKKEVIYLYYSAADTTCCLAFISLNNLLKKLTYISKPIKFLWSNEKKIIEPVENHSWESKATFNPAAIYLDGKVHLLYRAMSKDNTSVFGYAVSKNGLDIDYRSNQPVYVPRESFEQKSYPEANSGCEDPRLTKIGSRIYMCYTAYDGINPPRVALTSISEKDFLEQKWNWSKPVLISPPGIDDKDACILPEKIKGKYVIIHRSGDDIDISFNDNLDFDGKTWLEEYRWLAPRQGMWDSKKVGIASPPIKTKKGWLILYHGVSDNGIYRVGAVLSDLKDITKIIARTDEPIFEPRHQFQKVGQVPNVVFPCGAVVIGNKLFMYYGAADQFVGVATISLDKLLKFIESYRFVLPSKYKKLTHS